MTNLAFVGAGSLGQSFAGLLAASGQSVFLLATPASKDRLLRAGFVRLRGVVELDVPVRSSPSAPGTLIVTDDPSQLPGQTGLIFTTKGHQLPAAIAAIRGVWPKPSDQISWVAGVQNGVVKDDLLRDAFGAERTVGAVTILGAQRESDGTVVVTSRGATFLGELNGGLSDRVAGAVALLGDAGIPTEASADVASVIWSKECNAVGVFGVSVLARTSAPGLGRSPHLVRAYLSLIRETAAVAAAHGVSIGDFAGFPIRTYLEKSEAEVLDIFAARSKSSKPTGTESFPSMTQDLLAGRSLEVDPVFDDVVQRAARLNVPVPRITFVRDVIRGLDPGHRPDSV